jgi:kynureninase
VARHRQIVHNDAVHFPDSEASTRQLDRDDPLAAMRAEFHLPRHGDATAIYFAGNSLGPQPRGVAAVVEAELAKWRELAVRGHHESDRPWIEYHENLTAIGAELVGARPIEVVHMNATTVNLHLMLTSFYQPTSQRYKILMERGAFPSDRHAVASHLGTRGRSTEAALLEIGPPPGHDLLATDQILETLEHSGREIAVVMLSGVHYATGQAFELERIAAAARRQGCIVGYDLAHAVGNIPLSLHDWNVDFAVWCTYKYLNAGPGAVAGCYVHERYARDYARPRLGGWWGHERHSRFQMGAQFVPARGAEGWQISNPPILSTAPLLVSYEQFHRAGLGRLRAKSERLTGFLEFLLGRRLASAVEIVTPRTPAQRGCQLSLRLRHGREIGARVFAELLATGVICDWREPDLIRVAPAPLYNSFMDVWQFCLRLEAILERHAGVNPRA